MATPSVKRTPTTESLVELEKEKRAVYRTAVGKLQYMCLERADIRYSVKETARKTTCPTDSDQMNVKRIARHLMGVSNAKCLIDINTFPQFVTVYSDSDRGGQHVTQWRSATLSAWSRTQPRESICVPSTSSEDFLERQLDERIGFRSCWRW